MDRAKKAAEFKVGQVVVHFNLPYLVNGIIESDLSGYVYEIGSPSFQVTENKLRDLNEVELGRSHFPVEDTGLLETLQLAAQWLSGDTPNEVCERVYAEIAKRTAPPVEREEK